jgi:hypothetical protein
MVEAPAAGCATLCELSITVTPFRLAPTEPPTVSFQDRLAAGQIQRRHVSIVRHLEAQTPLGFSQTSTAATTRPEPEPLGQTLKSFAGRAPPGMVVQQRLIFGARQAGRIAHNRLEAVTPVHREGMKPMCSPAQDGCWMVAPLWPQAVQRAHCLSLWLDT